MVKIIQLLAFAALFSPFASVTAEAQTNNDSPQWEVGAVVGRLLPSQVDGVTEVMSLAGGHFGYRLSPMLYSQLQVVSGHAEGQKWKNLGLSIRYDQPLEDFLVSFYGGAQSTISSGQGNSEKNMLGAFVGGALLASTGGPAWLKMDMNFDKAILQIRDNQNGDVLRQIPTESQLEAYRRAQTFLYKLL